MTKSELFTAAHRAARVLAEGRTYRAAFAMALRALYRSPAARAAVAVAAPAVLTTAAKLEALANVVIHWPSSLRGTFAFRFICDNADRLARFGAETRFSDKQAAIIGDLFAKHC